MNTEAINEMVENYGKAVALIKCLLNPTIQDKIVLKAMAEFLEEIGVEVNEN